MGRNWLHIFHKIYKSKVSEAHAGPLCKLKIWLFEAKSSCSNCIKIFLVAIAGQSDTLWQTALEDLYTYSLSVVPFVCQQQRQSEALTRIWACEAHFGRLNQVWVGVILLLPEGLLTLKWWLWTPFHHNMPCRMGKIQWILACPSSPPAHCPSPPEEEFTMHVCV